MPTTFNWIHLGQSAIVLDPTEGSAQSEGASLLENTVFGSSSNPLYENVTRVTTINNGGSGTALDTNNSASNDAFQTDIGNGLETLIYDGIAAYSGTVTYTDGTTASFTAIVAQTTSGDLFLAPPTSANGDVAVLTARPIESITLGNVINNNADMANDRQDIGFDDGVVDGTAGDDLIDASYVEPVASGSDRVDNNDAPGGGNADAIEAGGGNDTVLAGLGNDSIDGGSGNDSLDGGAGSDLMQGGIGLDTLMGGAGDDTLDGGDGADVLVGDGGAGLKWNYEVYTRDFSSANGQAFDIESGTLAASGSADSFDVSGLGQAAVGGADPDDFGVIYTSSLLASDAGTYRFETASDDGSTIRILDADGNPVTFTNQDGSTGTFLNNDYHQGVTSRWGEVELEENTVYTIEVRMWENAGGQVLTASVTPPGGSAEELASSDLILGPGTTAGNDSILGGAGDDVAFGGGGNDTLIGGTGADTMYGGTGDDEIHVAEGDVAEGGDGDDLFILGDLAEPGGSTIEIVGGEGSETNGDTLMLTPDIGQSDITFSNTDDNAGGLSGSFTMADGTVVTFSEIENIICFTPGTRILTQHGERAVETLTPGDMVVTRDNGLQPVRWIGRSTVAGQGKAAPISLAASVMDGAQRDLLVSPQHRILFAGYKAELLFGTSEVLVAAKHLVDGVDVRISECRAVTYLHVMLDRHEVIYAEGAATESFHAGEMGLSAISEQSREEMFEVFPELRADVSAYGDTARQSLRAHEARLLRPNTAGFSAASSSGQSVAMAG